uniref:Uncharacterized protein n=1 Tax=Biomphalaria glabrata TaxID=6526 RepID=A0A2C9M701_BIOGL
MLMKTVVTFIGKIFLLLVQFDITYCILRQQSGFQIPCNRTLINLQDHDLVEFTECVCNQTIQLCETHNFQLNYYSEENHDCSLSMKQICSKQFVGIVNCTHVNTNVSTPILVVQFGVSRCAIESLTCFSLTNVLPKDKDLKTSLNFDGPSSSLVKIPSSMETSVFEPPVSGINPTPSSTTGTFPSLLTPTIHVSDVNGISADSFTSLEMTLVSSLPDPGINSVFTSAPKSSMLTTFSRMSPTSSFISSYSQLYTLTYAPSSTQMPGTTLRPPERRDVAELALLICAAVMLFICILILVVVIVYFKKRLSRLQESRGSLTS